MTALVAAQSLHRRIIDDLHGTVERLLKVKANPSRSEVTRFRNRPAPENSSRVPNGYDVILPIAGDLQNSRNHLCWRHGWSRRKRPVYAMPGCENLDVSTADIDNQHFHEFVRRLGIIALGKCARSC